MWVCGGAVKYEKIAATTEYFNAINKEEDIQQLHLRFSIVNRTIFVHATE